MSKRDGGGEERDGGGEEREKARGTSCNTTIRLEVGFRLNLGCFKL